MGQQQLNLKTEIYKCKKSVTYFITSNCKIKHPSLGIIPFDLFSYQKETLKDLRTNQFNIFKKTRQAGISTLAGSYALWFAMFHSHKTVLIVSKRDLDAKDFLEKNIKIPYRHLPDWMRELWKPEVWNEHEIRFTNGSLIRSLTSSKDTLRSNASSLNIIDEAAFMSDMESMWSAGWSTLQHGGAACIISTTNGVGGWYWGTWLSAKDKSNDFNPIEINWWDMDWALEYRDPVSGKDKRIAPTDNIKKCDTKEDIEKYGPYWSPWLEREYRGLESRGESHLFKQEILGEFIGGGGTIISTASIKRMEDTIDEQPKVLTELVQYDNPITRDIEHLDFTGDEESEGLWVWSEPVTGGANVYRDGKRIANSNKAHTYAIGVDIATGRSNDYSTIQIIDIDTMEQVAEYMGRVPTNIFCKMVDYIGRWYNNALICIERTGVGSDVVQDVMNLGYPNLWRRKIQTAAGLKIDRSYGFATSDSSKPTLNKALTTNISMEEDHGYVIKSIRLWKQLQIYVRHRTKHGKDTGRTGAQEGRGNHDDLVIALGLAFVSIPDAVVTDDAGILLPTRRAELPTLTPLAHLSGPKPQEILHNYNDPRILMPLTSEVMMDTAPSTEDQILNFTNQLFYRPTHIPAVTKRHITQLRR